MFLLTKLSLIFVVNILILIVGLNLIRSLRDAPHFGAIMTSLAAFLGLNVCYLIDQSVYGLETRAFYYFEYPFVLTLSYAFFEACISMSTTLGPKVLTYIRGTFGVLLLAWVPTWLYAFFISDDALSQNLLVTLPIGLIVLTFVWLAVRMVQLSRQLPNGLIAGWRKDVPMVRETASFFFIISVTLIASFVLVLFRNRVGDPISIAVLFVALNGAIILMICTFYMNYVARRFDITSQLMFGLQAMFIVVSAIVLLLFFNEQSYQPLNALRHLDHKELSFEPQQGGSYRIESSHEDLEELSLTRLGLDQNGIAVLNLPFAFPFGDKSWQKIWISNLGAIGFEDPALMPESSSFCLDERYRIAAFCSGSIELEPTVAVLPDKVVIDWLEPNTNRFLTRLILLPNGQFTATYKVFPHLYAYFLKQSIGFTLSFPDLGPAADLENLPYVSTHGNFWFDLSLLQRLELHAVYLPILGFMLGAFMLNTVLVWWWVHYRVRLPLLATHKALNGIRVGVLQNDLRTQHHDEFSDLIASFSEMEAQLRNLRSGQDEMTDAIEAELKSMRINQTLDARLPEATSGDDELLEKILQAVETHSQQTDFQVPDLADSVGLSSRQLHRKVLDLAGVTPLTLIRMTRLKKARRILEAGGTSVSQAAFSVGFRDIAYFSKLYRKEFGELPSNTSKLT